MTSMHDVLMRRGKRSESQLATKRTRSSKALRKENVSGKKSRTAILSWLSPTAHSRIARPAITPDPKATARVKESVSSSKALPSKQLYIDVGQHSFGKHVSCTKCGLLYTAGEEEDEIDHAKFCKRMQRGVTFSKWKTERVLKRFNDPQARILEIRGDDPISHVKKLLDVKQVLDDALGFVEEKAFLQRSHFVYIQDHQVVGCVTTERITKAFTLNTSASHAVVRTDLDQESSFRASANSKAALIGICQLWVHPLYRRKHVATQLVNVVREKSIYGMYVAKNLVAFAQPTRFGVQFAQNYIKPHEVLIY